MLTLLSGGRPDRVPWFGDLDYWATALIGQGEQAGGLQGERRLHRLAPRPALRLLPPGRLPLPDDRRELRRHRMARGDGEAPRVETPRRHADRDLDVAGRVVRRGADRASGEVAGRPRRLPLPLREHALRARL
ncbi:MAG: hypothetical protein M0C28_44960 [Candidatus Moduliflexus flocculans]|nr:hypothetical protein [Candidatus Moduliflexus flocculans]